MVKRYLLTGLLVTGLIAGLAPRASAQTADDVGIVVGNTPIAGSSLVNGVQDTLATLASTQSAVETSDALGRTVVDSGTALFFGISLESPSAPSYGSVIGYLLTNVNAYAQIGVLGPYLILVDDQSAVFDALDDPSGIDGVATIDDVAAILAGTPEAVTRTADYLRQALVGLLRGDIAGVGSQVAWDRLGNALFTPSSQLLRHAEPQSSPWWIGVVANQLAGIFIVGPLDQLQMVEDTMAPVYGSAAEVLEPLAELLEGVAL